MFLVCPEKFPEMSSHVGGAGTFRLLGAAGVSPAWGTGPRGLVCSMFDPLLMLRNRTVTSGLIFNVTDVALEEKRFISP